MAGKTWKLRKGDCSIVSRRSLTVVALFRRAQRSRDREEAAEEIPLRADTAGRLL